MARIPLGVQLLQGCTSARRGGDAVSARDLLSVLIAVILDTEDEAIVLRDSRILDAKNYSLVTSVIEEDGATVLTARRR